MKFLLVSLSLVSCTQMSLDDTTGSADTAVRVRPADPAVLGKMFVHWPNGSSTGFTFGPIARVESFSGQVGRVFDVPGGNGTLSLEQPSTVPLQLKCSSSFMAAHGRVTEILTGGLRLNRSEARVLGLDAPVTVACDNAADPVGRFDPTSDTASYVLLPGKYTFRWGIDGMDGRTVQVHPNYHANIALSEISGRYEVELKMTALRELPSACESDVGIVAYNGVPHRFAMNQGIRIGVRADVDRSTHHWTYTNDAMREPMMISMGGTYNIGRIDVDHIATVAGPTPGTYTISRIERDGSLTPMLAPTCNPITNTGIDLPVGTYRVFVTYKPSPTEAPRTITYDVTA